MMPDDTGEIVQPCLDTDEFSTVEIREHFLLLHDDLIRKSKNRSIGFDLPPSILRKLFQNENFSLNEAKIVEHVDSSLYEVIIFADRSAVHTRPEPSTCNEHQRLPFYVSEDLQLLKSKGFSTEQIENLTRELNRTEIFLNDEILQRIFDLIDVSTRLKCRQVCKHWCRLVDQSSAWKNVKLPGNANDFD